MCLGFWRPHPIGPIPKEAAHQQPNVCHYVAKHKLHNECCSVWVPWVASVKLYARMWFGFESLWVACVVCMRSSLCSRTAAPQCACFEGGGHRACESHSECAYVLRWPSLCLESGSVCTLCVTVCLRLSVTQSLRVLCICLV